MKTKYINKNCDWCLKDWYDGKEYITKICDFHQKYSYPKLLKDIKKEKRDRLITRIFLGVLMGVVILGLIMGIYRVSNLNSLKSDEKPGVVIMFVESIIAFPLLVWFIIMNEKDAKKWIKEYEEEKKEWKQIKEPKI